MKDWSGRVECLNCEEMFDSKDRRINRICPACTGKTDKIYIPDGPDHKFFGARRAAR